jgi:hypothetical protein
MTLRLLVLPAALLLACQSDPYGGKPDDKAGAADQAKDEAPAEKVAAKGNEHEEDPEAGCIYAEGEKDKEDDADCPHGHGDPGEPGANEGHFGSEFTLAQTTPLDKAVES